MKTKLLCLIFWNIFLGIVIPGHAADAPTILRPYDYQYHLVENQTDPDDACAPYVWFTDFVWSVTGGGLRWDYFANSCTPDSTVDEQVTSWPGNDWPPSQQGYWYSYSWLGDDYWEDEFVADPLVSIPQEHLDIDQVFTGPPYGPDGQMTQRIVAETLMELKTGGPSGSSAPNLWRIYAGATNYDTGLAITRTNVIVRGRRMDTNGYSYQGLFDNLTYEITPQVLGGENNYYFGMAATKARLRLYRNGSDITDSNLTIYAGEGLLLSCGFDNAIAPITNFSWSIPGDIVLNYDPTVTPPTLSTNVSRTNSVTLFHWYKPASNLVVQCSIISKGITLSAKATFNVIYPTHTVTPTAYGPVAVDTNWVYEVIGLHFGDARTNTNPGIKIQRTEDVNAGSWEWLQIINFPVRYFFCSDSLWRITRGKGLDGGFPYPGIDSEKSLIDVPGSFLQTNYCWVVGNFDASSYLMFKPPSPSIWVPVKQVNWGWNGTSYFTNGNHQLLPASSSFSSPLQAIQPSGLPTWTNDYNPSTPFVLE
jgi:hypothetical protein